MTEIKVFDEEALTAKSSPSVQGNDDLAYVYYDVVDQYGESMKASETINWTTSPNYIQNDTSLGRLTISNPTGFQYGSDIFVTGVHVKSGTSASVSVKVGASQAVDTIDFAGFLSKNDRTKIVESLPTDFPANTYVLLYKALDQNKHPLDMNDATIAGNITFINDNPTLINSTMDKDTTVYTVGGEEYAAIKIEPGISVDKGGEVNITAISNRTGNKSVKNFLVGAAAVLNSFQLNAPSKRVTDGEEVEIPFTATAADGTAITNYESIVRSTNTLSLTASVGTLKLSEKADGTASLVWKDALEKTNYSGRIPNAQGEQVMVSGMSSTYDSQERSIALTTIVVGGVSNNMMLPVSDMRYPAGIKDITCDTTVVDRATSEVRTKIDNDNPATITFTDQYGDVLADDVAKAFFEYTADNNFNGKKYSLKAVSNDAKILPGRVNGEVIATVTGGALKINLAADLGEGRDSKESAETSTVRYTIVNKADGDSAWSNACQAKSITYTIVPIKAVQNMNLTSEGTVVINTDYSEAPNGAKIEEAQTASVTANSTKEAWTGGFSYKVTGKYNAVDVTVPSYYYHVTTSSAIDASNAYVGDELTWRDLYDFNTYGNPRKTGKATLRVEVNNQAATLPVLSTKVDVSDENPAYVNPQLKGIDSDKKTVTPSKGKIASATFAGAAMNQWWKGWSDNAEWLGGFTVDITKIEESTSALTHLSNSFTVSGNGTQTPEINGAEIGDKFTVTLTMNRGGYSTSLDVTVGPDAYANISSDGSNQDKELRTFLGYNR